MREALTAVAKPLALGAATFVGVGGMAAATRKNHRGQTDWNRSTDTAMYATAGVGIAGAIAKPEMFAKAEMMRPLKSSLIEQDNKILAGAAKSSPIKSSLTFGRKFGFAGAMAVEGALTGLSAFGDSHDNTSNFGAAMASAAVFGAGAFAAQVRVGRAMGRLAQSTLTKPLGK